MKRIGRNSTRQVLGELLLVVEPQRRRRYTLDELLAQCNPKARRVKSEKEWLDSKPLGGELI